MSDLERLRVAKGLTQVELARKVKVSGTAVGLWENGLRKPRPKVIQQLAAALGLSEIALTKVFWPVGRESMFYDGANE